MSVEGQAPVPEDWPGTKSSPERDAYRQFLAREAAIDEAIAELEAMEDAWYDAMSDGPADDDDDADGYGR